MPHCYLNNFKKINLLFIKITRVSFLKYMIFEINPIYLQG